MFQKCIKDHINPEALQNVKLITETLIRYLDAFGKPTNYKHVTELIEDRFGVRIWYRNSLPNYLGLLVPICKELEIPPLPATVVRRHSGIPGKGFIRCYKQCIPESSNIENEKLSRELCDEAVRCQQWQLLLDHLDIDYRFKGNE